MNRTACAIVFSSPNGSPFSVIRTKRSTSGSTTIPKSTLFSLTICIVLTKFSGSGSGSLGKIPFFSQFNSITSQPNSFNNWGITYTPAPFTQSSRTLNLLFLIASLLMYFIFNTLLIWSWSASSSVDNFPSWSHLLNESFPLLTISIYSLCSSGVINSPLSFTSFKAFHSFGLWLAEISMPPFALCLLTANRTVGVGQIPISMTSTPFANKEPTTIW